MAEETRSFGHRVKAVEIFLGYKEVGKNRKANSGNICPMTSFFPPRGEGIGKNL
jgi:hypothetical protein